MTEPSSAYSRHQRATLIVTCVGTFMTLLDVAIVNTALPSIQRGLHESFSQLQWVIDAYSLAFAVLLLSSGALADRHGRKRLFQAGMAVFTLGSLLCGLSTNAVELEAARVLQGIGGAALAPASLALLGTAFPDARQRTRAVATWAAISALGLGVGPTVGGLLVSDAGWRWVFFINVPIGIACLAFGVKALAESANPAARHLDLPGQLTSVVWMGALTYGFVERGSYPWSAAPVWVPLAVAAVVLALFLVAEGRSREPMLPLGLFSVRLFSATAAVTLLLGFVLISVPFFTVQFFQDVQHLSALQAGLRMLAFSLMFTLVSPLAGRLSGRFGFRLPVTLGALTSGAGLLLLAGLGADDGYADVFWKLMVVGVGFGLMLSPLSTTALNAVARERSGLASSVANTTRQTGTVIGIALLGALVQTRAVAAAAASLHSLPASVAAPLAALLGHGGPQAPLPATLPAGYSAARLHQIAASAYVTGIHGSYAVGGIVLLVAAAVAVVAFRPARSAAPVVSPDPVSLDSVTPERVEPAVAVD
jgi:EmrB/QacA subfamily drug resistance transporter